MTPTDLTTGTIAFTASITIGRSCLPVCHRVLILIWSFTLTQRNAERGIRQTKLMHRNMISMMLIGHGKKSRIARIRNRMSAQRSLKTTKLPSLGVHTQVLSSHQAATSQQALGSSIRGHQNSGFEDTDEHSCLLQILLW